MIPEYKSLFQDDCLKDEKYLPWLKKNVSAEKAWCICFRPFLVFVVFVVGCDSCRSSCLWNKTLTVCLKKMPLHFSNHTLSQRQSPNQNRSKQQFWICLLSTLYSKTNSYGALTLYAVNIHCNQVTVNCISSQQCFLIVK